MSPRRFRSAVAASAAFVLIASAAIAELPDTDTLLGDVGFSADDIAQVKAGKFVSRDMKAASDRELVTSVAFHVALPPDELIKDLQGGLLVSVDPNTVATGTISNPASGADFATLQLKPDGEKQARTYLGASAGDDLNLSDEEIAAFKKLGGDAAVPAVEEQVRAQLLARAQAYQTQGLAGIAPYARGGGKSRSAADELRTASEAAVGVKTYTPDVYQLLLSYPKGKPASAEESFRWTLLEAHGVPTIALTHAMFVPEGAARIAIQRQFYVSTGYNSEEAVAALLPVATGTVVVYGNRTSTDQVTGFGGSAKRSIGSKLLASQLQSLFDKVRAAAK